MWWSVWSSRKQQSKEITGSLTLHRQALNANFQILGITAFGQGFGDALDLGQVMALKGTLNADSCRVTATSATDFYQASMKGQVKMRMTK